MDSTAITVRDLDPADVEALKTAAHNPRDDTQP